MGIQDNRFFLTPSEQAIADAMKVITDAGGDPFGDDDPIVDLDAVATTAAVTTTTPAPAPTAVAETSPAAAPVEAAAPAPAPVEPPVAAPAPVAEAPAAAPVAAPAEPPAAPVVVAVDLSDLKNLVLPVIPQVDEAAYTTKIDAAQAKIDALDTQFEAGELTAEQRAEQMRPLRTELRQHERELASQIGRVEALQDMARATSEQVFSRLRTAGAAVGLNYGDGSTTTLHAHQFNLASQMVASDPRNAALTWVEKAALADNLVRAQNGIAAAPRAAAAPAQAPVAATPAAPTAAPRQPPAPPNTIRDLPPAARPNEQSDTLAGKIAIADALGKDAIWKAMTKEQRAHALGED